MAMGYPPSPNPTSADYAHWKHMVTTPRRILHDEPIAVLNRHHGEPMRPTTAVSPTFQSPPPLCFARGNECSSIWSGVGLGDDRYVFIYGYITVPNETNDNYSPSLSSEWIGLGGSSPDTDPNLIQAGIELDWPVDYYAWYEYYRPGHDSSWGLNRSTHPVKPGDYIYFQVWASNSSGGIDELGKYGSYYVENETENWATPTSPYLTLSSPGGTFYGTTAEWIVERQALCNNCSPGPLTDFGTTNQTGEGQDHRYNWYDFGTGPVINWIMYDPSSWVQLMNSYYTADGQGVPDESWFHWQHPD
jgi:hypothetical protein